MLALLDFASSQVRLYFSYEGACSPGDYEVGTIIRTGVSPRISVGIKTPSLILLLPKAGEVVVFRERESFWQKLSRPGDIP